LVPVALRAINPSDSAFGRLPDTSVVDKALKSAKVVKKAPAKKAAAKKKSSTK